MIKVRGEERGLVYSEERGTGEEVEVGKASGGLS
jgi:hypothetical protein